MCQKSHRESDTEIPANNQAPRSLPKLKIHEEIPIQCLSNPIKGHYTTLERYKIFSKEFYVNFY